MEGVDYDFHERVVVVVKEGIAVGYEWTGNVPRYEGSLLIDQ